MVTPRTVTKRTARSTQRNRAKSMRHEPTEAETLFWSKVRAHRLKGRKFKRQYSIGDYTVDFVCLEGSLIVELDGGIHVLRSEQDRLRESFLIASGYRVIRFQNHEVVHDIEGVLHAVLHEPEHVTTTPSP